LPHAIRLGEDVEGFAEFVAHDHAAVYVQLGEDRTVEDGAGFFAAVLVHAVGVGHEVEREGQQLDTVV
jgi:hypothetical protein